MKKIRLIPLLVFFLAAATSGFVHARPQVVSLNHSSGLSNLPVNISDADGLLFTYPFILSESSTPSLLALASGAETLSAHLERNKFKASKALRANAKTYLKDSNTIFLSLNAFNICYPFHTFW